MSRYWVVEIDGDAEGAAAAVLDLEGGGAAAAAIVELPPAGRLSARERDVLELVARGAATKRIARELGVCERTVKSHVWSATAKLGAENRTHAAVLAARLGLLRP